MSSARSLLTNGTARAFAILITLAVVLIGLARFNGISVGPDTGFSILQDFATFGPVALGLGLTMLVREFDISFAGMFGLGGCVAILLADISPTAGILAALLIGLVGGTAQGILMVRLQLSSVAISLGGLLTFSGISYVLTANRSIPMDDLNVALFVNRAFLGIFSLRSILALVFFAAAAFIVSFTRLGRDMIATGSDRNASVVAGVNTASILIGAFATSGVLSALSGALLSFSLSAASPAGLADISVPTVAAVILGGASLSGGAGRPLGTAAGVLILCVLRTGVTALGVSPYIQDLVTGGVLLSMATLDGQDFVKRSARIASWWRGDEGPIESHFHNTNGGIA